MTDILDRLRDTDANRERFVMGGPGAILPLLRDAADEIERLRKQPPDERVYVLIGEEKTGYGDDQHSARDLPLAVCRSREVLEGYRNSLMENAEYAKFTIQGIPMIGWKGES